MGAFRVILQDNLWFRGAPNFNNYVLFGSSMIPVDPLLGRTSSSDPRAKMQELQWLQRYTGRSGRGLVVSQEWIQPGDLIDVNLRETFLPILDRHGGGTLWNIFYDPVLAAFQRGLAEDLPIDFGDPRIRDMWESDLGYLRELYFDHPSYWRLGGRPVLYVWAVHSALTGADGSFHNALDEGIYLLGDALTGRIEQPEYLDGLPPMSGATGFLVVTPELGGREGLIHDVTPDFAALYGRWNAAAAARSIDFIPAGSCQYDDTEFQSLSGGAPTRYLARDVGEVEAYMRVARDAAAAIDGVRYAFWGTANNWAEGTTVLPTERPPARTPPFYPFRCSGGSCAHRIGHYGFAHLEALRRVFFARVPAYAGPVVRSSEPRPERADESGRLHRFRVDFRDCDVAGRLRVHTRRGVEVLNPPDLETFENLRHRGRFRLRWSARVRVDPDAPPSSVFLRIRFRNLDGRRATQTVLDGAIGRRVAR